MARLARAEIYNPDEVAIVHVIATTVRKCFLFGDGPTELEHFSHRRHWVERQIEVQAAQFGIEVIAFATMSNHLHQVLKSRPDIVATWDDQEIAKRWLMICPKRKDEDGKAMEPFQKEIDSICNKPNEVKKIRRRLSDISWWMRILCQRIAIRANMETKETGRFFNGRFKAIRLLDEQAILACSVYVDLNEVRASISSSIEQSEDSSISKRFQAFGEERKEENQKADAFLARIPLNVQANQKGPHPSKCPRRCSDKGVLPLSELSYLEIVDLTSRIPRYDKPGFVPEGLKPLLDRLNVTLERWVELTTEFDSLFSQAAGSAKSISEARTLLTNRSYSIPAHRHRSHA